MSPAELPIVAIVGRPNVGKSTLFNRYAGRRRALVADVPGLTRDRIAEEVSVAGRRALVVDTAGLEPEAGAGVAGAVQRQAREAVRQADAILFVVDAADGLLPIDAEIARQLRRTDKPVLLAVNKVDTPAHEARVAEFHRLGIGLVRGVSAEHGRGAWDALEELVAGLPAPAAGDEAARADADEKRLRIAIVGRPNVGKSSLTNALVGSERVVVSEEPGTTRDAVDVRLDSAEGSLVLVDTAGVRRQGRRTRTGERGGALMTVRALERAQIALVVIDASDGVTDQDARVAALALERGCATAVLANKWDLVEGGDVRRLRDAMARQLRFLPDAPCVFVSARTGRGVERILPVARRLAEQTGRRVATAELNRWLRETVARHEPAMAQRGSRRRPLKFFYATQLSVAPPTFVLFCTEPKAVMPAYTRFLENQLRKEFGFAGTPLRLLLRARRRANG
jgi:GTP-binding protein